MKKPMQAIKPTRRLVIGAGLAGAALLTARPVLAQAVTVPDLEATLALLQSEAGIKIIYARFSLAYSLTLDLAVRESGAETENPEPAGQLPVLPAERPGSFEPFVVITELTSSAQREAVHAELSAREDPLDSGRGEPLNALLDKVASGLADVEVTVGGPIADALGACAHVERVAAITRDTPEDSSFLCKYFPFTRFC